LFAEQKILMEYNSLWAEETLRIKA